MQLLTVLLVLVQGKLQQKALSEENLSLMLPLIFKTSLLVFIHMWCIYHMNVFRVQEREPLELKSQAAVILGAGN